ncbi:MAG TPA: heparinase II/III family protein [Planctomycetota bacterium]|nr:heparinase II/III family protein [Planctomycetota bacterium]
MSFPGLARLALLLAVALAAGAADAAALAELRGECLRFVAARLKRGPVADVPWSKGMVLTIEGLDLATGMLDATMGTSGLQVPVSTVDTTQLAHLMRQAAGPRAKADLDACAMSAALFRVVGDHENARLVLELAKTHMPGVDERYARWADKLQLATVATSAADKPVKEPAAKDASAAKKAEANQPARGTTSKRKPIAKEHPRVFGSRSRLQQLATERPAATKAMLEVARQDDLPDSVVIPSRAFAYALTGDKALGRGAIDRCKPYIDGEIKVGHVTFGHDLAWCAIAYDCCHDLWTKEEIAAFHSYMNRTVDANVGSEVHVFHNGWFGYKNWGIGLACYATMHENPKAGEYLKTLEHDYVTRAAPALELAGDGGSWIEGHYLNYWITHWLCFMEAARLCEGVDYYEKAPRFFANRALCGMFDIYPGEPLHHLNRAVPHGDGGYGDYGGFSEMILAARRILCGYYRNDPAHQAIASYSDRIETNCIPTYAWWTFLFDDRTGARGDYHALPLSHVAPGAGAVFARSSWDGDATWFQFRCGDRLATHQHLDVGHFMIYRRDALVGDAGAYDDFAGDHVTNFYMRSIAHNTVLIHDPAERWPAGIRAFPGSTGNDGGQAYPWLGTPAGHNAAMTDVPSYQANRALMETGDLLAYADHRAFVYTAGDATRAYNPEKCATFTRQIVFLRPSTFVIFDRVRSRRPDQKKYWIANLHATPTPSGKQLVATNGDGRLFIQTVLPAEPEIALRSGGDIYTYFGESHPPSNPPGGPVAQCRVEVSSPKADEAETFLHVLTAVDATLESVPTYDATVKGGDVAITVGPAAIVFSIKDVGGSVTINGQKQALTSNLR